MKQHASPTPRVLDRYTFDRYINELTQGHLCNSPTRGQWKRILHPRLVKDKKAPVMWCGIELVGDQINVSVGDPISGRTSFGVQQDAVTVEWLVEKTRITLRKLSPKHACFFEPVGGRR